MRYRLLAIVSVALISAPCIAAEPAKNSNDLVAVGRVKNLTYERAPVRHDVFGYNKIVTARFRILRLLSGTSSKRTVIIRYISSEEFLAAAKPCPSCRRVSLSESGAVGVELQLRRRDDGTYVVCAKPEGEGFICD